MDFQQQYQYGNEMGHIRSKPEDIHLGYLCLLPLSARRSSGCNFAHQPSDSPDFFLQSWLCIICVANMEIDVLCTILSSYDALNLKMVKRQLARLRRLYSAACSRIHAEKGFPGCPEQYLASVIDLRMC